MIYFKFKDNSFIEIDGLEYTYHFSNGLVDNCNFENTDELAQYIYFNRDAIEQIDVDEYLRLSATKFAEVGDLLMVHSNDGAELGTYRLVRVDYDHHILINSVTWNRLDSRVYESEEDKIPHASLEEFYNIKIERKL